MSWASLGNRPLGFTAVLCYVKMLNEHDLQRLERWAGLASVSEKNLLASDSYTQGAPGKDRGQRRAFRQ